MNYKQYFFSQLLADYSVDFSVLTYKEQFKKAKQEYKEFLKSKYANSAGWKFEFAVELYLKEIYE